MMLTWTHTHHLVLVRMSILLITDLLSLCECVAKEDGETEGRGQTGRLNKRKENRDTGEKLKKK